MKQNALDLVERIDKLQLQLSILKKVAKEVAKEPSLVEN